MLAHSEREIFFHHLVSNLPQNATEIVKVPETFKIWVCFEKWVFRENLVSVTPGWFCSQGSHVIVHRDFGLFDPSFNFIAFVRPRIQNWFRV